MENLQKTKQKNRHKRVDFFVVLGYGLHCIDRERAEALREHKTKVSRSCKYVKWRASE